MPRTTSAQARFKTYSAILEDEEKRRKEQERIYTRETKKVKRAGFGQFLGALIGSLLMPGVGTGIGSRLGSEIGERSVRGTSRIDEGDYLFGITGEGGIRQANFEMRERERAFNQQQTASALTDALSGMIGAGLMGGKGVIAQRGGDIATGGGVNVIGDVVRAGSREELLKGLTSQRTGQGNILEMLKKLFAQQGQQSLLNKLLQDRQKRTRKPFNFGGSPVDNFRINQ